jgi:putative DNA primase/helicase
LRTHLSAGLGTRRPCYTASVDGKILEMRPKRRKTAPAISEAPEADRAFADRLYHDWADDLFFVQGIGWLVWDGRRYRADATSQIIAKADETICRIHLDAYRETNPDRREVLAKLATRYSKIERVRGGLAFLQARRSATIEQLDADPCGFNVANGTIDLRTGKLRPHTRADRITKVAEVEYDPAAPAPRWYRFLTEIFDDNLELVEYLKRLVGYSLTADQRDHRLPILVGPGSNGKSTLVKVLFALGGDYAMAAPASLLLKKYSDAIPTDVAGLRGARIVVASETPEDGRLDETRVKLLTGAEGKIAARYMRQDFFEFNPTHHLFLQTNHKPRIVGTDFAIWRRIRLIPFDVIFEEVTADNPAPVHPADPLLDEKLRAELPGILAWAVEGAKEWFERGLRDPSSVLEATKTYRREEDVLADFVESRCVTGPKHSASVGDLFAAYESWCDRERLRPWSKNRFSRRLSGAGYQSDREEGRVKLGIALKEV